MNVHSNATKINFKFVGFTVITITILNVRVHVRMYDFDSSVGRPNDEDSPVYRIHCASIFRVVENRFGVTKVYPRDVVIKNYSGRSIIKFFFLVF